VLKTEKIMEYTILKQRTEVSVYVKDVSLIADRNKKSFGFTPSSAYEEMAAKGQLWVVVNKINEIKGYLTFGGTMPTLKVFQVYACPSVKGQGVGSLLINELKKHARKMHYHSISARVAADLPANNFWDAVGFPIYQQVKGGKTTKRIINIRGFSLEDNDLFAGLAQEKNSVEPIGPILEKPVYALDLNLLLAVYKAREGYEKVIKILQIGFQGGFSICVTPEFKKELERQSANFSDDPVMRLAALFPEVTTGADIDSITVALRDIVFPCRTSNRKFAQNDESDLRHLAYCVLAGIQGFITKEKALLRACNTIKDKYGVQILSPSELVLDDGELLDIETPLNTDFSFSASNVTEEIKLFFKRFSVPSSITDMLYVDSPVKEAVSVYEARLDGSLFGVYFFNKPTKGTHSALAALYVDENCPQSVAAIDHFLETALRYKSGFSYRLDLYIGKGQYITENTLKKKGFFKTGDHFVKVITSKFLYAKNWERFSKDLKAFCGFSIPEKLPSKKELINTGICIADNNSHVENFSWFDFESIIGPRFILSPDRDCIIVPIRENYANGLIGNVTKQQSLLTSHEQALLLEKAYFRSSNKATLFKKGGIIAFYVSGSKSIQELIGFARISYSDIISIDEAIIKVDRQGVLSRDELTGITDKQGKLHVFTFDNFLEFDRRISFRKAKDLGLISDANLVSPERINLKQLKTLIGETFDE